MAYATPFTMAGKRVLITGASSGLGAALARRLAGRHAVVGLIARREDRLGEVLADCRRTSPGSAMWVADLADTSAVRELALRAWDALGGIDVLINNAAVPKRRPVTALEPGEVEDVMRVNFFAPVRLTLALLPRMLARASGLIVNVSSVGGRLTLPFFGVYNATKYAVEALSDALRYELRPFNIDVALIEPGVIRTNFEATAVAPLEQFKGSVYAGPMAKVDQLSKTFDRFASEPIVIARAIAKAVRVRRPAARYVAPRSTSFLLFMKAVLPTRAWDWSMRKLGFLTPKVMAAAPTTKPALRAVA